MMSNHKIYSNIKQLTNCRLVGYIFISHKYK